MQYLMTFEVETDEKIYFLGNTWNFNKIKILLPKKKYDFNV